jgi:predicted kinase
MQAIIFCGIPATGITTFYQQHFLPTHVRISLDLLRPRHRANIFLEACLQTRQKFVVNNTNPKVQERAKYINLARQVGYEIMGYYFKSNVTEALTRNQNRTGKALVPEKGIWDTNIRMEIPSLTKGFDAPYHVQVADNGAFTVRPEAENPLG